MNPYRILQVSGWAVFLGLAVTYLAATPAHPEWRFPITAALIVAVMFNLAVSWLKAAAYVRRAEAAAAPAAE